MFRLSILGSNSAIPVRDRLPTAQILRIGNASILIDCGEGTQMQLRRYRISMQRISHIFISHLHGDHYFGLIGLISTLNLLGHKNPIHIYADPRLEALIQLQLELSDTVLNYPLHFNPIHPDMDGLLVENEVFSVEAFPLNHRIPTHGFLFCEKISSPGINALLLQDFDVQASMWEHIRQGGDYSDEAGNFIPHTALLKEAELPRKYAFVSDTAFLPALAGRVGPVDLMYHEATFMKDKEAVAAEKFHSTAEQAAMLAKDAGAERLIIGHFSARYKDAEPIVAEARAVFPNTWAGMEGDVFDIPRQKRP
jgi:ribonuclease Z